MGSIIRNFKRLPLSLFFALLLFPTSPLLAAEDLEGKNMENIEEKATDIQEKENAAAQENAAPGQENSSMPPAGEENLRPVIDASAAITDTAPDMEKGFEDQVVYPGVQNATIIRKIPDGPSIELYYPVFGNQAVDEAVKLFAEKQASEYEENVSEPISENEERPSSYEQWEMSGYFNLEHPNPNIVSVIFNIFSYSGGAHGNLVISCLNYNLKTGKPVDFADLFKDPEKALEMMSAFSAKKLGAELGEYADEDMILSGTTPDLSNFSNLSLVPNGLYIEFQPYQVGPWAAGPQRVAMTLEDLAAAGPEPDIWPTARNLPLPPQHKENETDTEADQSGTAGQD